MDETLEVARARAGDPDAFMRLVTTYQARVRGLARGLVGDAGLAEDVAQETFLRAWRGLGGLRQTAAFPTWLYSIARRTALELRRGVPRVVPLEAAPERPDPAAADPALRRDLQVALATLDDDHRQVFLLVAVAGLTYDQVAEIMHRPAGTVASRMARARARLAALLADDEEVR